MIVIIGIIVVIVMIYVITIIMIIMLVIIIIIRWVGLSEAFRHLHAIGARYYHYDY